MQPRHKKTTLFLPLWSMAYFSVTKPPNPFLCSLIIKLFLSPPCQASDPSRFDVAPEADAQLPLETCYARAAMWTRARVPTRVKYLTQIRHLKHEKFVNDIIQCYWCFRARFISLTWDVFYSWISTWVFNPVKTWNSLFFPVTNTCLILIIAHSCSIPKTLSCWMRFGLGGNNAITRGWHTMQRFTNLM